MSAGTKNTTKKTNDLIRVTPIAIKATTLKKAALIAGSLSFLAGSALSQTAVSGAGGYTTYNLSVGFNLIGVSLFDPVIVSGTIDSEAGATITTDDRIVNNPSRWLWSFAKVQLTSIEWVSAAN